MAKKILVSRLTEVGEATLNHQINIRAQRILHRIIPSHRLQETGKQRENPKNYTYKLTKLERNVMVGREKEVRTGVRLEPYVCTYVCTVHVRGVRRVMSNCTYMCTYDHMTLRVRSCDSVRKIE